MSAILEKSTGKIIGQAGLLVREVNGNQEIESAYSILRNHRRNGFALEAIRKCKDFAFENNFHERLISMIIPENINSKKTAEKNGYPMRVLKAVEEVNQAQKSILFNKLNFLQKRVICIYLLIWVF